MSRKRAKPSAKEPVVDETKEEDEYVVLCFKVLTMPIPLVPGCSKVPCADCGQMVWISKATREHVADKPHKVACAECVGKVDDPDIHVMTPSAGQIAEITSSDPTISEARIRRMFPESSPVKRKAAFDEILRRTKARKRLDN